MLEREAMREPEAEEGWDPKEIRRAFHGWNQEEKKRLQRGRVVIRGKQIPWTISQQAITKFYEAAGFDDPAYAALNTSHIFIQELRTHSGKHTHQGGFSLFVLQGRGYTVVDGVRHDWKEGDLILLPIKPGGVEHQHFNLDPEKPAIWLALCDIHQWAVLGRGLYQQEAHPMWQAMGRVMKEFPEDVEIIKE